MVEGTAASMVESLRVKRRCWATNRAPWVALVRFEISWTTPSGRVITDEDTYNFRDLMDLPNGVVAMLTAIFDPDSEEPRIEAHAYLLRVHDEKEDLPDVVARLIVQTEHAGPDEPFELSGTLAESGPNIYPLPIHEAPVPE
jgi:hypothetical protein